MNEARKAEYKAYVYALPYSIPSGKACEMVERDWHRLTANRRNV